jgi:pimeloyl-ACP methyl ester carboxylesterase
MRNFTSYDGTELGYRVLGDGPLLVCLPGGPGRTAEYFGDLGGLDAARRLVLLDPRGVGLSADPADPSSFRVDRLVEDVESLRLHLGLDRMDLLAHSAGCVLATLYAAAYPQNLSKLILVTPGLGAVDVNATEEQVTAALERRADESWYESARAALDKILSGDRSMEAFHASRPLFYGRWNEAAKANAAVGIAERNMAARDGFFVGAVIDPPATKAALEKLTASVLLYAGERDAMVTPAMVRQAAPLFNDAAVVVQPEAAHFPWIDDPKAFAAAVGSFLG